MVTRSIVTSITPGAGLFAWLLWPGARQWGPESRHLLTEPRSSNADEHRHYALGCLGWYRPISPPPGSRIFVIEPQRSSATIEHSTPFARSASISVLRLSHMK